MDRDALRAAVSPRAIRAALRAAGDELLAAGQSHGHGGGVTSVRTATHRGHDIVVRTTYEITVDGRPFDAALTVDNRGRVHYHGLPTRDFQSAVALVKKAIDLFPGDFPGGDDEPHEHPEHDQHEHPEQGHEHGHEHEHGGHD